MRSLLNRIGRFISFNEVVYFLLIYVSMYAVLLGVELVARGTSTEVLSVLILLGILMGWLLSRSRLNFWLSAGIAILSGFLISALHISGVGAALKDFLGAFLDYLALWVFKGASDPARMVVLGSVVQARTQEMVSNVALWAGDLLTGFSVYNQISTLITWGLVLWLFSCWFAWATFRRNQPIWGLLPAGTTLAILMTYTLQRRFTLVLLLGAGLILIGMVNYDIKGREWREKGIRGADNVRERAYLAIVGFSLSAVAFAGLTPSIRIDPIADRFERLVYGSEEGDGESSVSDGTVAVGNFNSDLYTIQRFAGLPRQKLIGSGPELAKRVVMVVSYPTTSFVETELPNAARYWRAYSYDWYTGSGWQSSPTVEIAYQPGQEISGVYTDAVEVITQEIRLGNPVRGTLFSAGPPLTVDHEALVSWRTLAESGNNEVGQNAGLEDLFAVTLDTIIYQVRSLVPTATDEQLRDSRGDYPDWVLSRYLELPETVPQRVLDMAEEITANQPTRYDQAKALESFLRSYPYTLDLPAPPADRDVADYFLFDLQAGYCDYYATAMVVLARAAGMPARVVVGYVGGQYDPENDYYLVSEADAHTWVEVYFSGYGWIPFEPTAARGLIDEKELTLPLPPELVNLPQVVESEPQGAFPWWQIGVALILAAAVGLGVWSRIDVIRLRRRDATSLVLIIYQRLYRYGRWMGLGHRKTDTLYEFSDRLIKTFQEFANKPGGSQRLREGISEISRLTEYAVQANFSRQPLDQQLSESIFQLWISLRSKLRSLVWRAFWRSLAERLFLNDKQTDRLELIGDGAADGTR